MRPAIIMSGFADDWQVKQHSIKKLDFRMNNESPVGIILLGDMFLSKPFRLHVNQQGVLQGQLRAVRS